MNIADLTINTDHLLARLDMLAAIGALKGGGCCRLALSTKDAQGRDLVTGWVVGVAKAGCEEGCDLIGGSCIITPTGEIVAECKTLGDELIVYQCDLERCQEIKTNVFDFARHRHPESYQLITATKGVRKNNN